MTMVNDILKQMPGLGQPQRKFLATLFVTILVLRGRVNFRNLSRYCDYSERTIARQFREPFDWPDFHQRVLRRAGRCRGLCRYRDLLDLKVHVRIPALEDGAQFSVERSHSRL
jgi:hypothetical protein